jgi:hypothetical protein
MVIMGCNEKKSNWILCTEICKYVRKFSRGILVDHNTTDQNSLESCVYSHSYIYSTGMGLVYIYWYIYIYYNILYIWYCNMYIYNITYIAERSQAVNLQFPRLEDQPLLVSQLKIGWDLQSTGDMEMTGSVISSDIYWLVIYWYG